MYYNGTFEEFMREFMFWFNAIGQVLFMVIEIIISESRR